MVGLVSKRIDLYYYSTKPLPKWLAITNNEIARIEIQAIENRIKVFYNHDLIIDWQEDSGQYPSIGTIGLVGWTRHYERVDVAWDNILVQKIGSF